ncbi:hypothetical protein VTN00DRAFT_9793 [Thermoascus crustaceus]|uniref:uncharacterized protein n=1 Tax=Thermoascus crustaceus TaxID=5088 RepID=UPI0037426DBB
MRGGNFLKFLFPPTPPAQSTSTTVLLSRLSNALESSFSSLCSEIAHSLDSVRDTMDAIFSIPLLSFLFIPAFSSYSTSLNLLFFYMTWATLVLSHPPLRVEVFGTAAVRGICFLLPSLLFFLFDILTPSAAVVLKAHGETGLPAGSKRGKKMKKQAKVVGWALLNLALSVLVQGAIEYLLTQVFGAKSALRVSIKLPMPWEIVKDLLRGFLGREILSYVIHRYILHAPGSFFGKFHLSWYHSLRAPYPLTAHYDHPAAYMLSKFFPTYGPALIFRFHMLTYVLYLAIVSIEETFAYSGYKIMPTNFFLGSIARRVDVHVLNGGEGNYGPWGILDWICGTAVGETIEDDLEEEMEEYEVDDKVRRALEVASKRRLFKEGTTTARGKTRRRRNS